MSSWETAVPRVVPLRKQCKTIVATIVNLAFFKHLAPFRLPGFLHPPVGAKRATIFYMSALATSDCRASLLQLTP